MHGWCATGRLVPARARVEDALSLAEGVVELGALRLSRECARWKQGCWEQRKGEVATRWGMTRAGQRSARSQQRWPAAVARFGHTADAVDDVGLSRGSCAIRFCKPKLKPHLPHASSRCAAHQQRLFTCTAVSVVRDVQRGPATLLRRAGPRGQRTRRDKTDGVARGRGQRRLRSSGRKSVYAWHHAEGSGT